MTNSTQSSADYLSSSPCFPEPDNCSLFDSSLPADIESNPFLDAESDPFLDPELNRNEEYCETYNSIDPDEANLRCPRCSSLLTLRKMSERECILLCENTEKVRFLPF